MPLRPESVERTAHQVKLALFEAVGPPCGPRPILAALRVGAFPGDLSGVVPTGSIAVQNVIGVMVLQLGPSVLEVFCRGSMHDECAIGGAKTLPPRDQLSFGRVIFHNLDGPRQLFARAGNCCRGLRLIRLNRPLRPGATEEQADWTRHRKPGGSLDRSRNESKPVHA